MRCNAAGIALIKRNEALRLNAYLCPAGKPTIGYGHTGDVKLGDRITEHQADAILSVDLDRFERGVEALLEGAKVTENQFSALVSFTFNVGLGGDLPMPHGFKHSHLLYAVRTGDTARAATEFGKWTKAGGKVLPGLVRRRCEERALFLS